MLSALIKCIFIVLYCISETCWRTRGLKKVIIINYMWLYSCMKRMGVSQIGFADLNQRLAKKKRHLLNNYEFENNIFNFAGGCFVKRVFERRRKIDGIIYRHLLSLTIPLLSTNSGLPQCRYNTDNQLQTCCSVKLYAMKV